MSDHGHDDLVRRSFKRQVNLFARPDSPFALRAERERTWLGELAEDWIVLDVACGAAHVCEAIARSVRQVVGVDLTPELLALGAARIAEQNLPNVLLLEANAQALPFVDKSFDLVFCRSSLHHLQNPQVAVGEMTRACRHGGRLVLSDLVGPDQGRDAFDELHRLIDPSHVRTLARDELVDLLPEEFDRSHWEETEVRLPIDVALTDQSQREAVIQRLRAEVTGGERTGFQPREENGAMTVSFPNCVIHGTRR